MPEKVYAFIDSQNVNLGVQQGHKWKLDFKKFRIYLKDKLKVTKAFLFIGNVPGNETLYSYLQKCDYEVILKPTLEYHKDKKVVTKGNVDAELVLHAMIEFPNYDKAVIATGDGDFYCLIEYLESKNKFYRLLLPSKHKFSALLRKYLTKAYFIHDSKKKLEYKKNERH